MFLFFWSHTADVLCIEVHKQMLKVRGGEWLEGIQSGSYESELYLGAIRGVFLPTILLKNFY
jgi:hypothetical protein